MSQAFIKKIEQTVLSNLENEKFGVSELAQEMNLSRSQLLRKTKSFLGKSTNQFIREIRLKEAVRFILNSDLTASEIAYKVGFSSPSYFNKCFLDYFNLTPGDFKKKHENDKTFDFYFVDNSSKKNTRSNFKWIAVVILLICVGLYYQKNLFSNKSKLENEQASIAVLPLEDYSENMDFDYLASGITEAINLELSKNKSLRVISRGSCERFKNDSNTPYNMIAKELGVNLLLEGSVFPNNDSLLVVVQLISPFPKERHIWSNKYHRSTKNILQLVQNISNSIAKEISTTLIPKSYEKGIYNINTEAYNLYLKGKHLWYYQKTRYNSLIKAKEYLEKSIKIDPNFAAAYVTLAETYISINKLIGDNHEKLINRGKARNTIDMALELDDSSPEAYFAKSNLLGKFDWNWKKMKEMAEIGLILEPNSSEGHMILSNYYTIKGNYQNAIKQALLAESLDPLNPAVGSFVAEKYYIAKDLDRSITKYNEVLEIEPDYGFALNGIGYVYHKKDNLKKMITSWRKLQTIMKNDSLGWYYDNKNLDEALNFYLEKAAVNTPNFCSNPSVIASIQMMVNDKLNTLKYLKIAFQNKNEDLPMVLTYPIFQPLHGNPEFQEIVQKTGVVLLN